MKSFYLSLRLAIVTPTIALILGPVTLTTAGARVRRLIPVTVLVLTPARDRRFAVRAFRALFAPAGCREAVIKTGREIENNS